MIPTELISIKLLKVPIWTEVNNEKSFTFLSTNLKIKSAYQNYFMQAAEVS